MQDTTTVPPLSDRGGVTDAVRAQLLATEHWSLLATRSATWNEMFSRAGMYLTVLSAATVALALVAQATEFGDDFQLFALLVLPVVLLLGLGTQIRLVDAQGEDLWLVLGMNRLRHAYLELAPELEPYFITAHHDDLTGAFRTYGPDIRVSPGRILATSPTLVGIINGVVTGVFAALVTDAVGGKGGTAVAVGVTAGLAYVATLAAVPLRRLAYFDREWRPRFPGLDGGRG